MLSSSSKLTTWLNVIRKSGLGQTFIRNLEFDATERAIDLVEVQDALQKHDASFSLTPIEYNIHTFIAEYKKVIAEEFDKAVEKLKRANNGGSSFTLLSDVHIETPKLLSFFVTPYIGLLEDEAILGRVVHETGRSAQAIISDAILVLCELCRSVIFAFRIKMERKSGDILMRVFNIEDLYHYLLPRSLESVHPNEGGDREQFVNELIALTEKERWTDKLNPEAFMGGKNVPYSWITHKEEFDQVLSQNNNLQYPKPNPTKADLAVHFLGLEHLDIKNTVLYALEYPNDLIYDLYIPIAFAGRIHSLYRSRRNTSIGKTLGWGQTIRHPLTDPEETGLAELICKAFKVEKHPFRLHRLGRVT